MLVTSANINLPVTDSVILQGWLSSKAAYEWTLPSGHPEYSVERIWLDTHPRLLTPEDARRLWLAMIDSTELVYEL